MTAIKASPQIAICGLCPWVFILGSVIQAFKSSRRKIRKGQNCYGWKLDGDDEFVVYLAPVGKPA